VRVGLGVARLERVEQRLEDQAVRVGQQLVLALADLDQPHDVGM
jgi:hypothetical protein